MSKVENVAFREEDGRGKERSEGRKKKNRSTLLVQ